MTLVINDIVVMKMVGLILILSLSLLNVKYLCLNLQVVYIDVLACLVSKIWDLHKVHQ
jgi:hypothetical protein